MHAVVFSFFNQVCQSLMSQINCKPVNYLWQHICWKFMKNFAGLKKNKLAYGVEYCTATGMKSWMAGSRIIYRLKLKWKKIFCKLIKLYSLSGPLSCQHYCKNSTSIFFDSLATKRLQKLNYEVFLEKNADLGFKIVNCCLFVSIITLKPILFIAITFPIIFISLDFIITIVVPIPG